MVEYKGTGGPPPGSNGGGSRFKKFDQLGISEPVGQALKKVKPFFVPRNKELPVTFLDNGEVLDTSVRLHTRFLANGNADNHVVCIADLDARGCPLDGVLKGPGKWFACGTVLDGSAFTPTEGKNANITYQWLRRLLLVNPRQVDLFNRLGTKFKGLHGRTFDVARGNEEKSARIGESWIPTGVMTDDEMKAAYAEAAKRYGLSVEQYIQPLPYDKLLAPLSYEKLQQIAASLTATGGAAPVVTGTGVADDDEIPF